MRIIIEIHGRGFLEIDEHGYESNFGTPEEVSQFLLNEFNHALVRKAWNLKDGIHLSRAVPLVHEHGTEILQDKECLRRMEKVNE